MPSLKLYFPQFKQIAYTDYIDDFRREFISALSSLKGHRGLKPKSVDIELTNRCNLRCRMCWFWGESGVGNRYGSELTKNEVYGLVRELLEHRPHIYIGGGEPFVRGDLLEILKYIKNCGLTVSLTTNGTLLHDEVIVALIKLGLDGISFSIDGGKKIHDYIRGKGVFDRVTSRIKKLNDYRRKYGLEKPIIVVNTTITELLVGSLEENLREIIEKTDNKADQYRIQHLWYVTDKELSAHQLTVKKLLGARAHNAKAHLTSFTFDAYTLADEVIRLRKKPKVRVFPDLRPDEIINYYTEFMCTRKKCVAPFLEAVVKPNGDVVFCPDEWIDDYVLGNIRTQKFMEIWNGEMSRRFRAVLSKYGCFPACKRCCFLYIH